MRPITDVLRDGQWRRRPCFVVGSGPSLRGFDFARLSIHLTIGCNEEYRWGPTIGICQDVRFFRGDGSRIGAKDNPEWYGGNSIPLYFKAHPDREDIDANDMIYSVGAAHSKAAPFRWGRSLAEGLAYGANVGIAALNLADILGADPIYLLGFDCKAGPAGESHHHDHYPANWRIPDKPSSELRYEQWRDEFARHSLSIQSRVVNLGPDSALTCFEMQDWRRVLCEPCEA